jgi:ABC-type iron transport system FetAB permease component
MCLSDISILGVVAVLILLSAAIGLFAVTDRRTMHRVLRVLGVYVAGILVLGGGCWLIWRTDAWWACAAWLVVMLLLACGWCLHLLRPGWQPLVLPVGLSLLAGSLVGGGSLMLCLPKWCFVPVFGMVIAGLITSVTQTVQTYQRSLLHTEAHRQYLVANGASVLESLMPSVRRALRASVLSLLRTMASPLVVMMPMLFAGLLLGGASPAATVAVSLLSAAAVLSASVVAGIVAIYCFKR